MDRIWNIKSTPHSIFREYVRNIGKSLRPGHIPICHATGSPELSSPYPSVPAVLSDPTVHNHFLISPSFWTLVRADTGFAGGGVYERSTTWDPYWSNAKKYSRQRMYKFYHKNSKSSISNKSIWGGGGKALMSLPLNAPMG